MQGFAEHAPHLPRLPPPPRAGGRPVAPPARPVPHARLPGPLRRPDAALAPRRLDLLDRRLRRRGPPLDLGGAPRPARRDRDPRHPLRDEVDEARHQLDRRLRGHAPRGGGAARRVRRRLVRRRLHHEPPARGRHGREGVDRLRVRRRAAGGRARRPGAAARAAPVLLEERQVGARAHRRRARRARLLGGLRLPQLRRPVARAAVLGRLSAAWRTATVLAARPEAPGVRTLVLGIPEWPGHQAGQHVDVRLTAEDGYQAQRSYSIASPPEGEHVELTVEELPDGEVSPYLVEYAQAGDQFEVRGPIGGYFTWHAGLSGPLLLVAGGSGVVPLMAMIRHRREAGSTADARLLLSVRTRADIVYRAELETAGLPVHIALTREAPADWPGYTRRIDLEMLREVGPAPGDAARVYVCGPTPFVEEAARLLVELGHPPAAVRTERFGNTGG